MKYGERVAELFEKQGFKINQCFSGFNNVFKAEKEDEVLLVGFDGSEKLEKVLESIKIFSEIKEKGKKVFFTCMNGEEEVDKVEKVCGELGVEPSFFQKSFDKKPEPPENMPSSYEVIGSVVVISPGHGSFDEKEVAEYIVDMNPNVETVLLKTGDLSGEFRVGEYRTIYGEETETVYKEHGTKLKLDPTKVFFSERLGNERKRVVDLVEEGEVVQSWFAGVGPYPIVSAKHTGASKIYGIEKNPVACGYMKENVELNKVDDRVEVFCGDVEKIAPTLEKADRIIMPLPKGSKHFLGTAFDSIKDGGVIHYYRFAGEDEWDEVVGEVEKVASQKGKRFEVVGKELCGHYAPYIYRVCLDFKVFSEKDK